MPNGVLPNLTPSFNRCQQGERNEFIGYIRLSRGMLSPIQGSLSDFCWGVGRLCGDSLVMLEPWASSGDS